MPTEEQNANARPINVHFIYTPKTGSRVFARNLLGAIGEITWSNWSSHIVGDFAVLTYATSVPTCWWRDTAKAVAARIIEATSGVAYDEQGTIRLLIPRGTAAHAHRLMVGARHTRGVVFSDDAEEAANESVCLADGSATLDHTLKSHRAPVAAEGVPSRGAMVATVEKHDCYAEGVGMKTAVKVRWIDSPEWRAVTITAPAAWGEPTATAVSIQNVEGDASNDWC